MIRRSEHDALDSFQSGAFEQGMRAFKIAFADRLPIRFDRLAAKMNYALGAFQHVSELSSIC